jgi:hypothetical protein
MLTSSPLDFHLPGYNRIEEEEENVMMVFYGKEKIS